MIMGTWKLISLKQGAKEIIISPEDSIQRLKYITKSHFVWIQYLKNTRVIRNSAGGTYTFKGNDYIENHEFVGFGSMDFLNKIYAFKVYIIDNKMYLSGLLSTGIYIDEIWQRLD